ncbi:MAG: cation:proton antiporter [Acholeplasmatales bacterium]|nr:cation:proton antiporter [Acholeplasmatales bacterium]
MLNTILAISAYEVLFPVGLILVVSKIFGVFAKRFGLPQILAMLLTGIVIGLFATIPAVNKNFITDGAKEGIAFISELGVVLILFSAGLGTDLKQVKACGLSAFITAMVAVVLCMLLGALVTGAFFGWSNIWSNIFYGVTLTATSVSVTVATLKELGKLNSKIGTTIVSAAIIDDIIGVIILSVILSLSGSGVSEEGSAVLTTSPFVKMFTAMGMQENIASIFTVVLQTILFFVFIIALAFVAKKTFSHLERKYPHHRRIPIYGIGFAFLVAFFSEKLFGIADITGAFFAGLILAGRSSTEYVERRTSIASYIIFTPVFFANIGISTDWAAFTDPSFLTFAGFGFAFLAMAIIGKLVGAAIPAKLTGNNWKDALCCGAAMCVRAEVCLVSAQKGIDAGLVDDRIKIFLIILIVSSSIIVPLVLKAAYKNDKHDVYTEQIRNQLAEDREAYNSNVMETNVQTNEELENSSAISKN